MVLLLVIDIKLGIHHRHYDIIYIKTYLTAVITDFHWKAVIHVVDQLEVSLEFLVITGEHITFTPKNLLTSLLPQNSLEKVSRFFEKFSEKGLVGGDCSVF